MRLRTCFKSVASGSSARRTERRNRNVLDVHEENEHRATQQSGHVAAFKTRSEKNQAFGSQSKQSLSDICFKKPAVVDDKGNDKYKRTLGRVKCEGIDANAEQVRRGMAWAYRQYLTDQSIVGLEDAAKARKIGLWVEETPTPPWDFRHGNKAAKTTKQTTSNNKSNSGYECGGKTKCAEMNDCAEANFYLNKCGLNRLDRDHDGVPCESICR